MSAPTKPVAASQGPADLEAALVASIRGASAASGLTGAALAQRSGIRQATLARKLAGCGEFTVRDAAKLADALGTTASKILSMPAA